jgi:hypothetical protein
MFYVNAWKTQLNIKAFVVFTILIFFMIGVMFALIQNPFSLLLFFVVFMLIPIWILSPMALGKHDLVKMEIIKEIEIDRCYEVKRFWWLYATPIAVFSILAIVTERYNLFIHAFQFLILAFLCSRVKIKALLTDKGIVLGKNVLVTWNEIKKAEVKGDYVILRKGRFSCFVIRREYLNDLSNRFLN